MKPEIVTGDDQLKKMREGYRGDIKLSYGGLDLPCRLMSASEEASVISSAKLKVKVPEGHDREFITSIAVMKAVLKAACTVDNTPYASESFLDKLSDFELEDLFDQYVTIKATINPKFESLSVEKVVEMIAAVKKKEKTSKDFYTSQLAAIGKFFLDTLLPKDNAPGS